MLHTIKSEIDLDAQGKHVGYLRLPHSVHRSAYGWLPIPIASIKRGEGPVFIVSAGSHGDEYEGQIIASSLIREISPDMVNGQIIILPMLNFPAADAGTRTSPLDDGNLNRLFPGVQSGTPTQVIAHFVEHILLAKADYIVDLHSGGSSLLYDGANMMALEPRDKEEEARLIGLLKAFGLPRAFLYQPNSVNITAAARRQNALCFLTELGGAGSVDKAILQQGRQGLLNLMGFTGVLSGSLVPESAPAEPQLMSINRLTHYAYANHRGIWEPLAQLGDEVQAGQPAALIHFPDEPLREPQVVTFDGSGQVICKRATARVERGDCLFQLAAERPGLLDI